MICQINTCNEKNLLLVVFSFFKTHGTERVKKNQLLSYLKKFRLIKTRRFNYFL